MAAPQRPEQGHSRYPSSDTRRVAMPRRSTKGPLDVDVSDRSKSYTELPTTNTSTTNRIAALTSTHFHAYANSIACLVSTLSRRPTESRSSANAFQKPCSENHATGSFSAASSFSVRSCTDYPPRFSFPRLLHPTTSRHRSGNSIV
ncbi:hypothetical protein KCU71_g3993, partial [Aureobasidium melanogenum]